MPNILWLPQEQVIASQLSEKGDGNGALSYVLVDGQRAISVSVDDVAGVSGYITAGDYVDVVATILYPSDGVTSGYPVSTVLVENVLVLKTGMKELTKTDSAAATYTSVTLSASPEDVLKINYAATNGKLRLVLRPVLDNKTIAPRDFPTLSEQTSVAVKP